VTIIVLVLLILKWAVRLYTYVLWARFILDWVRVFNPRFRPRGILLVLAELVFTLTDPPIRMFRRILPPIKFGQVALDLGWMVTMFCCLILLMLIPV
jgi:YggT family protein